jgi:hypothetical protein
MATKSRRRWLMADALKIFRGKVTQVFAADFVLGEGALAAFKTQASQPACDLHRRFLRLGDD